VVRGCKQGRGHPFSQHFPLPNIKQAWRGVFPGRRVEEWRGRRAPQGGVTRERSTGVLGRACRRKDHSAGGRLRLLHCSISGGQRTAGRQHLFLSDSRHGTAFIPHHTSTPLGGLSVRRPDWLPWYVEVQGEVQGWGWCRVLSRPFIHTLSDLLSLPVTIGCPAEPGRRTRAAGHEPRRGMPTGGTHPWRVSVDGGGPWEANGGPAPRLVGRERLPGEPDGAGKGARRTPTAAHEGGKLYRILDYLTEVNNTEVTRLMPCELGNWAERLWNRNFLLSPLVGGGQPNGRTPALMVSGYLG